MPPSQWGSFLPQHGYTENLWKIRKDTAKFDSVDANNLRKIWRRDSIYILIVNIPVTDTATKKPLTDSTGQPLFKQYHFILPDSCILKDFNKTIN